MWCGRLMNVILSSNITNIANETFMGCSTLSSISIPDGVTSIGDRAFNFINLTSITIPKSVNYIGNEGLGYGTIEVYYEGSEDEWNEIQIVNSDIVSLIIYYNSDGTFSDESLIDEVYEEETGEEGSHSDAFEKIPNDVDEELDEYILEDISKINRSYLSAA